MPGPSRDLVESGTGFLDSELKPSHRRLSPIVSLRWQSSTQPNRSADRINSVYAGVP